MEKFKLVAHRGDVERYPENTLASLSGAIEANVKFIEIDVICFNGIRLVVAGGMEPDIPGFLRPYAGHWYI